MSAGKQVSVEHVQPDLAHRNHLHVIVNPHSGNGKTRKRWPAISAELMAQGFTLTAGHTTGPNDATRMAREFVEAGARTIVAVGGDGTVNEVINGMIADGQPINSATRLMVVPGGTGKDLGRTLQTGTVDLAIQALKAESIAHIDLGRITFMNERGVEESRYFANVADLGLGAAVARRINQSSKALGGLMTYLLAAVRTIVDFSPHEIQVDIDGHRVFDASANMVVLANGQYFAGGMHVAPTASLCDGLLEVYILSDVGKRAMLTSLLPRVYSGKHIGQPGILHARTAAVTISCDSGMLMEMDGEQCGTSPIRIEVVPRILPVVMGAEARRQDPGCAEGAH